MLTVQEKISQAKAAGYTDDQIASHLGSTPEFADKIKAATAAGYKASDIVGHLSDAAIAKPTTDQPGILSTAAGFLGKGISNVALAAPTLLGKGLSAVGLDAPAQVIESAKTKLVDALAPYKAANPTTAKIAETAGEIAATAPVGGILGAGVKAAAPLLVRAGASAPIVDGIASAIGSGGMRTGMPAATTLGGKAADLGIRALGGGITGGASAALVDPGHAGTGAVVGAALPGAARMAGAAGNALSGLTQPLMESASQRLMQSAIKPTIAQLRDGSAQTAVDTLLKYGINPTKGGVNKLRDLIDGLNDEIATKIGNSTAKVDKTKVLNALADTRDQFTRQVSPAGDISAIQGVADGFAKHPLLPTDDIPVALAQQLKQGTYGILSKKYGQVGTAETEAQKALARGLKEEIATAVPGVQGLNAEESKLIGTLNVAERRAFMAMNNNPVGIAGLAKNPLQWGAMMLDKSPLFKALAARAVNASSNAPQAAGALIERAGQNRLLQSSAPIIASDRQ